MAGAGGDLTTTVATAPTRITLVTTIGVIITTTATTTINDDNGSGAYELRYPLTDKCSYRPQAGIVRLQLDVGFPLKADMGARVLFYSLIPSLLVIARIGFVPIGGGGSPPDRS